MFELLKEWESQREGEAERERLISMYSFHLLIHSLSKRTQVSNLDQGKVKSLGLPLGLALGGKESNTQTILDVSPGTLIGSGIEVEQLGLKLVFIWDDTAGRAHIFLILFPLQTFSSTCIIEICVIR